MDITAKQLLVLDYIKRFIAEKSYAPTVREIMQGLALKSPSTVHEHLKTLATKGLITFSPTKSRTIELLVENEYAKEYESIVHVPIIASDEFMDVPKFMLDGYDVDSIVAYKKPNVIYLVNKSLKSIPERLALYKEKNGYNVIDKSKGEEIGTVISKFEVY